MSSYHNNSIFWIETEKIKPNPYQPRREFEPKALEDLADSLRQYGVLQPLVVTRKEMPMEDGHGMSVYYELIAGERRLRASKIAGLQQVPVIIRKETDDKVKLELAIIENLQREDLNPIDRALAFEQLYKQFNLTHADIGKKMGKSRVYVSNSLRLLSLPKEIQQGLMNGRITEGHTRPLLMLSDKPEEQDTLYKEIMLKKMSVRESEKIARKIAQERVRKKEFIVDPRIQDYEKRLSENLGTRVHIEPKEKGGRITIDYFTLGDLDSIIDSLKKSENANSTRMMDSFLKSQKETTKTSEGKSYSDIKSSTGIDIVQSEKTDITESHKSLPEFHHDPSEEIVSYQEEIESHESHLDHEFSKEDSDSKEFISDLNLDIDLDFYKTEETQPQSLIKELPSQQELVSNSNNEIARELENESSFDEAENFDARINYSYRDQTYHTIPQEPENEVKLNQVPEEAYVSRRQLNNYSLGKGGYNNINDQVQEDQSYHSVVQNQNQQHYNNSYVDEYRNPNIQDSSSKKKGILGSFFR